MLGILQQLLANVIELFIFMVLWSNFCLKDENSWLKNLFVILIGTSVMILTSNADKYINVLISYSSVILSIKFIYKRRLLKTTLEFIIFSCINFVIQASLIAFMSIIGFAYAGEFIWRITLLLLELSIVLIIIRSNFVKNVRKFIELESKILFYFIINLGLYAVCSKLIWEYNKNIILNNLVVYILIVSFMLLLNIFLYYYIVKISEDKKVAELQNRYNPILVDIVEEIRRKQHDFRNQLNTINAIVEITSEKEVKHELKKFMLSLKCSNNTIEDILYIDNIIVKAIIYNKLCEADRLNIKLVFHVTNNSLESSLSDYEISGILNNLLDNAFDAVTTGINDKVVILNIRTEGTSNIVEVKNSGITVNPSNIQNIFKRGFSTKKGNLRGYGLYNIKKIVEKTGNNVQLLFEDNYTIFKISFK
ncbi:GHKL domain-containing protein [Clostridium algoriphilum]|uniref:sensor histidine kinase n=1 Tax=Clostridium algoriphilum TaxID=198347 RepID=UPI001CF39D3D|nr:GHKL domain-containing protein [Clostridium algoriphilum]MCB2295585.1 GHKL domain-containing protein [Clostridium algoriphilum]